MGVFILKLRVANLISPTFLRFCLIGGLCTIANLAFLYVATDVLGFHYLISCVLSFLIINFAGFLANRLYSFRVEAGSINVQGAKYYGVMSASLLANLLSMYIFVSLCNIHYLVASILVTILLAIGNYLFHLNWTFKS